LNDIQLVQQGPGGAPGKCLTPQARPRHHPLTLCPPALGQLAAPGHAAWPESSAFWMHKTSWGHIHHPPSPPSRASYFRREAAAWEAAWEAAASRVWVSAAGTVHGRCASRPASDLAIAMGCPGQPGIAGVVSRVAELQLFCRRAAFWPKCGRTRVSAFRRRTGGPVLEPTRGRPRPRNGLPRAARIFGGRFPRC